MRHHQRAVIESESFDEACFQLAVDISLMRAEFARQLIASALKKMVKELTETFEKEGKAGVRRWVDKFSK
jgi:hypothetical protein